MSLPATDNFDAQAGGDVSGNWTQNFNGFRSDVSGHLSEDNGADYNHMYWNADVFGNDQYSQATFLFGGNAGVGVRMSGVSGSHNAYYVLVNSAGGFSRVSKIVAGSITDLIAPGAIAAPNVGDVIKISVTGSDISVYYNGVLQTGTPVTDGGASLASGSAGIMSYGTTVMDDWEGGNAGAAPATAVPVFTNQYRQRR